MKMFNIKKIIGLTLIAVSFIGVTACTSESKPSAPPPGWDIVCNLEKGYYAPRHLATEYVLVDCNGGCPLKTKQAAIDRAWRQYNFVMPKDIVYLWEECK